MHRILKHGIRSAVRALGYDIMPLRDLKERDLSIHLAMLFDRLAIDCVLDVGANVGQYRDFLREKVLYSGPIVSFEPVARNVATLRDRARHDRKWHVEGYALGAETRTTTINVMRSDQFSSFLEPDNARVPSFTGLNAVADTELVSLQTLDLVLPRLRSRLGFKRPYLKLDTQGYDLEAIRGCEAELPSI